VSARISAATHAGSLAALISTRAPDGKAITAAVATDDIDDIDRDADRGGRVTSIRAPSSPSRRARSRRRRRHHVSVVGASPCSAQNAHTL
jgi:hypothetical protein